MLLLSNNITLILNLPSMLCDPPPSKEECKFGNCYLPRGSFVYFIFYFKKIYMAAHQSLGESERLTNIKTQYKNNKK